MINRSKIAILSTISNLAWFVLLFLWNRPRVMGLVGEPLAKAYGVFFIALVVGFSVLNILGTILVMSLEKRKGGQGFEEKTDERDRYIEGRAMKIFGLVFTLGFLAACTLLALNLGLHAFFACLAFTMVITAMSYWITYFIGYERGL